MKNADQSLDCLLEAAAAHRRVPCAGEAPFGFATRVVGIWKADAEKARLEWLWLRRAFLCSMAVTALSAGWSYRQAAQPAGDDALVAGYDIYPDLP